MEQINYGIVGDIGGTNARFALTSLESSRPEIFWPQNLICADYRTLDQALDRYLASVDLGRRPKAIVLAVAGPVVDGAAVMTNCPWSVSEAELRGRGFQSARVMNDYAALGLGATDLSASALCTLGTDREGDPTAPVVVLGAGTGFGAAIMNRADGRTNVLVTEAGHMGFAPSDEVELELVRLVAQRYGRASVERFLSGPGLRELYSGLAAIRGTPMRAPASETITRLALAGEDELCVETVQRFCAIYGAVAGDVALAAGARGGVFLAGGIAPKILPLLKQSRFRSTFEAKGRLSEYVRAIPTRVIVQDHTALIGAAKQLRRMQPLALV
jgi:glucokinase